MTLFEYFTPLVRKIGGRQKGDPKNKGLEEKDGATHPITKAMKNLHPLAFFPALDFKIFQRFKKRKQEATIKN